MAESRLVYLYDLMAGTPGGLLRINDPFYEYIILWVESEEEFHNHRLSFFTEFLILQVSVLVCWLRIYSYPRYVPVAGSGERHVKNDTRSVGSRGVYETADGGIHS